MLVLFLLAYPKKQSSPAPGLHFFSCGAFGVKFAFHISSSQAPTPPHWPLCLSFPGPYSPAWWNHGGTTEIQAKVKQISQKVLKSWRNCCHNQANWKKAAGRSRKAQTEQDLTLCKLSAKFMATEITVLQIIILTACSDIIIYLLYVFIVK